MEARFAIESLCCANEKCKEYGQRGKGNLIVRKVYGEDKIRYLRCNKCGIEFSERKGTALYNSKIPESKAVSIIEHLDRKNGVVATAELVKVAKDTVSRLSRVTGEVFSLLHDAVVRGISPIALEFDEKWSFTGKKQKNVTAQDEQEEVGDHWDVNCIDPQSKLLVTLVPGKRTLQTIQAAVLDAASRLDEDAPLPAIFTDGESAYQDAILNAFGNRYPSPRSSNKGQPPNPIIRVPQELVYAQVVKHRQGGKVIEVEIRPIFGKGRLESVVAVLGWKKANTSAIERFNLTDRSRNARKARKSLNFSRNSFLHDSMSFISALLYNFHHFNRSLNLKSESGSLLKRTPAMVAGLAHSCFSVLDLMRICPIGL